MEEKVMVSVICDAYNHAQYIRSALDGFVMQKTDFPFEVIVHDDASTDGTADIIREYASKYPELIKPILQPVNLHQLPGKPRRKTFEMEKAQGKYVALCEGDDYWTDPLKLQKQFDFMEANPDYTLCGCSTVWLNMVSGEDMGRSKTDHDIDVPLGEFLCPTHYRPFPYVSFFCRREIWETLPNWGFPVGDVPLTYYAAMQGKVRMLADVMCVYRFQANGSWTRKNNDPRKRGEVSQKMVDGFERMNADTGYKFDEEIKKALVRYKYSVALCNRDYKALRSKELVGELKRRTLKARLIIFIRCKMPWMYESMLRRRGFLD